MSGSPVPPEDLPTRLRSVLDEHESWARAASRTYEYADKGATVPEGGVHWRWVHGDNWDTTNPDPGVEEWVGGEPGAPVHLVTVEEWPVSSRLDDGTVLRTRMAPLSYANEVVEMDPAAAGLIQRYDPAHVLRTIQAHREIIALYVEAAAWYEKRPSEPAGEVHGLYTAMLAISAIYLPDIETGDPSAHVDL